MRWRPNVVRSLRLDPRHHEEVQNSPENKIHIRKVIFRVSEKFGKIPVLYRKVPEGPPVGPLTREGRMGWAGPLGSAT